MDRKTKSQAAKAMRVLDASQPQPLPKDKIQRDTRAAFAAALKAYSDNLTQFINEEISYLDEAYQDSDNAEVFLAGPLEVRGNAIVIEVSSHGQKQLVKVPLLVKMSLS